MQLGCLECGMRPAAVLRMQQLAGVRVCGSNALRLQAPTPVQQGTCTSPFCTEALQFALCLLPCVFIAATCFSKSACTLSPAAMLTRPSQLGRARCSVMVPGLQRSERRCLACQYTCRMPASEMARARSAGVLTGHIQPVQSLWF